MNDKQKQNIVIVVLAAVVVAVLFIVFTKKSGFDSPTKFPIPTDPAKAPIPTTPLKRQRRPMTQQEMDIKLSNERAAYAATSRGLKQVQSDARYAANLAHEQKKNEIKQAMWRSRQGGAEGAAGAARFAEIQNLVKQGDGQWKQALAEVFEMKGWRPPLNFGRIFVYSPGPMVNFKTKLSLTQNFIYLHVMWEILVYNMSLPNFIWELQSVYQFHNKIEETCIGGAPPLPPAAPGEPLPLKNV